MLRFACRPCCLGCSSSAWYSHFPCFLAVGRLFPDLVLVSCLTLFPKLLPHRWLLSSIEFYGAQLERHLSFLNLVCSFLCLKSLIHLHFHWWLCSIMSLILVSSQRVDSFQASAYLLLFWSLFSVPFVDSPVHSEPSIFCNIYTFLFQKSN